MRIVRNTKDAKDAKDEKCKRNAILQKYLREFCDEKFTTRDLKYQNKNNINNKLASKRRHAVCKDNYEQNSHTKCDFFSGELYHTISKSEGFIHCKEKQIKHQEKCDFTEYTLRKAQVRLDVKEKHESEKLKSSLSESYKTCEYSGTLHDLDWMFQYTPATSGLQEQVVCMMNSVTYDHENVVLDHHVCPPTILRDSGFQGSNAPAEEHQEKTTEQAMEENRREFYKTYVEQSSNDTETSGPEYQRQECQSLGDDREEIRADGETLVQNTAEVENELVEENEEDTEELQPRSEHDELLLSINDSMRIQTPSADQAQTLNYNEGYFVDIHGQVPPKFDFPPTNEQFPDVVHDANSLTIDGPISGNEDDQTSDPDSINGGMQVFPAQARFTLRAQSRPIQDTEIPGTLEERLIHGAQLRPIQDTQIPGALEGRLTQRAQLRPIQDSQIPGSPERAHEGHMTSVVLEAGHQEQLLQQCLQRVTGGNIHLAKQFLLHLMSASTLLSDHCGVILCGALQTVLWRGEGGKFTSGGQYIVLSELGHGGFGTVHLCETVILNGDHLESVKFALKRVPIRRFKAQEAMVYIDHGEELAWMLDLKGIVRDGDHVDLLLQLASGGSLLEWIEKQPNLQRVDSVGKDIIYNQIHSIVYQLLCCTSDLNRRGMAHWDVKAWNILFTNDDCQGSGVVLADFGTAKVWEEIQRTGIQHLDGTRIFCPPEIEEVCVCVDGFLELELVEAWNVGATIYHSLTGHHLWFEKKQEFRTNYPENWRHYLMHFITSEGWRVCEMINKIDQSQHPLVTPLVMVMSQLLEYDACLRRTATEVLDLPIFSDMRQQRIPSCVAEMEDPPFGEESLNTVPKCRPGKSRRFPENPYAKLVVFYENKPIFLKYFEKRLGLHLPHLSANMDFQKQLELHVPHYEDGYILLCPTRRNVGTIYQDTDVYVSMCATSSRNRQP